MIFLNRCEVIRQRVASAPRRQGEKKKKNKKADRGWRISSRLKKWMDDRERGVDPTKPTHALTARGVEDHLEHGAGTERGADDVRDGLRDDGGEGTGQRTSREEGGGGVLDRRRKGRELFCRTSILTVGALRSLSQKRTIILATTNARLREAASIVSESLTHLSGSDVVQLRGTTSLPLGVGVCRGGEPRE